MLTPLMAEAGARPGLGVKLIKWAERWGCILRGRAGARQSQALFFLLQFLWTSRGPRIPGL